MMVVLQPSSYRKKNEYTPQRSYCHYNVHMALHVDYDHLLQQ